MITNPTIGGGGGGVKGEPNNGVEERTKEPLISKNRVCNVGEPKNSEVRIQISNIQRPKILKEKKVL
jgi:hypothetical protein